uniref:3-methyladenine DNA glycosylase AlkD n=1 Tax=Microbacter margulisiae TaxID=1350067 RepID=A0A7W5H153_9PORP|nr:DNA alkylation repair protein [Microbacter margulisiae]MBB3186350.1 3-methyladenine DNA glycosylase AlkD [Microbacter margulisiae]
MTPDNLAVAIRTFCMQHANEANVKKYSRFFKGEYNAYGLSQPEMQAEVKTLRQTDGITLETVLAAAPALIAAEKYEEASFALLLTDAFGKQFSRKTFDTIASWYAIGITNWAHADTLGMIILPKFLLQHIVTVEEFRPWLQAKNPFQRRSVPVTLIKWIKKNPGEITSLFPFLDILMQDPVREVHQGIGWYLREAWKLNPEATEAFLLQWKETSPRLIFQYACEKMQPEAKARFKRSQPVKK